MTLYGKGIFVDVIGDFEMRSSWIIWVGPKSKDTWTGRGDDRRVEERATEDVAERHKECWQHWGLEGQGRVLPRECRAGGTSTVDFNP